MFNNKTVIITGASSGIGKAMTATFLEKGGNVVINSRNKKSLERVLDENINYQNNIKIVAGDIGQKSTGIALRKTALKEFGRIDILINNAGTFIPKPFLEETEESLERYFSTAVKGAYFTSQAAIPTMIEQEDGCIINIGSMWVEHPLAATPCSASQVAKGGLHVLTRHLAIEFAANNIRVNTIAPAVIETPLYDDLMSHDQLLGLAGLHPLNKLGTLEDITSWATHLAGIGGRFVTGQTFHVDGGITAGGHNK